MHRFSYKKMSIVAIVSTAFLLFISYLYNNNPYPVFDNIEHYCWLEHTRQEIKGTTPVDTNFLYINVAYDKKLIPYNDENEMPLGNIDVTDRSKISDLLSLLNGADYKYIFLDVRFEEGYVDNDIAVDGNITIDQQLFSQIKNMPRLIVANHSNIQLAPDSIKSKTALSEYMSTITATNFVRYEYRKNDQYSVPLHIYSEITGNHITQFGPLHFDNGRLCYTCPFLQIPSPFDLNNDDYKSYYNMGADILDEESGGIGSDIKTLARGKYVIIGDFVEDIHDTYIGPQPGCYITSVALNYLFKGKHFVNWLSALCMGIVYFLISIIVFTKISVIKFIPYLRDTKSRFLRFLISLISIGFVMLCITDVIYLIDGETFCLWIPTIYFTTLRTIITYKDL